MFQALTIAMRAIEGLVDRVGRATLWIALAMIALVAVNVLLRYAFSFGSVWAQELDLMSVDILARLNRSLRSGQVSRLRCVALPNRF